MKTKNKVLDFIKIKKNVTMKRQSNSLYFALTFPKSFKKYEIKASQFLSVDSPIHLAYFFNTSLLTLSELINNPQYYSFAISKKKGGARFIEAPNNELKQIQSSINYYLQYYYLTIKPTNVHGFVISNYEHPKKSNIIENARLHIKSKYVLTIDLKDFFSSISSLQIYKLFSSELFDYKDNIAKALTFLCTYKGILPTGAPTSPVLSNLICLKLDTILQSFCNEHEITYSRYADDLTFSSNKVFSASITSDLKSLIEQHQFTINQKKIRLKTSNRKQIVTGLVVNHKVNINRKTLKLIRAILHDCKINGIEKAATNHFHLNEKPSVAIIEKFRNKLKGHINFIQQVRGNDSLCKKMREDYASICV